MTASLPLKPNMESADQEILASMFNSLSGSAEKNQTVYKEFAALYDKAHNALGNHVPVKLAGGSIAYFKKAQRDLQILTALDVCSGALTA